MSDNLTLALDGWSSPNHRSIWNFTILTPNRKEYIFQLSDLSSDSHTGEYIAEKIEDVINRVGVSKFSAIVSDNRSNVRKALQHPFADKLLKKVNILATFFRNNARAAVLTLERREVDLSDCYLELAQISLAIKKLPCQVYSEFFNYCIEKINARFNEFDDNDYLLV
ncbi:hypothetical protein RhiirC2_796458 [Rhizophagus irregularis]|uniref:DUF659 domain-containing protein n=1 Tax=Rhizophagus irregularis TaxID=588596 RepID=A0A2N1M9N4_9GLOM|nr:hypothetical protein RhiirC2_796458 [Rhizophagus irregularis]